MQSVLFNIIFQYISVQTESLLNELSGRCVVRNFSVYAALIRITQIKVYYFKSIIISSDTFHGYIRAFKTTRPTPTQLNSSQIIGFSRFIRKRSDPFKLYQLASVGLSRADQSGTIWNVIKSHFPAVRFIDCTDWHSSALGNRHEK